jgi:pyridoxal phosphate enzyme (YggS family)
VSVDGSVVAARLAQVREEVAEAARRAGRAPQDVELLAATKYVDAADLPALHAAGIRLVGENRSDALLAKQAEHQDLFTWDFIGHLQSRKVRDVVGRVRLIHAVDSLSVCRKLQDLSQGPANCLLQVNVADEETKSGVALAGVDAFLEEVAPLEQVRFGGLMTMPPLTEDAEAARPWFVALRELRDRLAPRWQGRHEFAELSMGTSQDYAVAAAEGATIVRVGSVLYER